MVATAIPGLSPEELEELEELELEELELLEEELELLLDELELEGSAVPPPHPTKLAVMIPKIMLCNVFMCASDFISSASKEGVAVHWLPMSIADHRLEYGDRRHK